MIPKAACSRKEHQNNSAAKTVLHAVAEARVCLPSVLQSQGNWSSVVSGREKGRRLSAVAHSLDQFGHLPVFFLGSRAGNLPDISVSSISLAHHLCTMSGVSKEPIANLSTDTVMLLCVQAWCEGQAAYRMPGGV